MCGFQTCLGPFSVGDMCIILKTPEVPDSSAGHPEFIILAASFKHSK